jgi:hypothetical protein
MHQQQRQQQIGSELHIPLDTRTNNGEEEDDDDIDVMAATTSQPTTSSSGCCVLPFPLIHWNLRPCPHQCECWRVSRSGRQRGNGYYDYDGSYDHKRDCCLIRCSWRDNLARFGLDILVLIALVWFVHTCYITLVIDEDDSRWYIFQLLWYISDLIY